MTRQQEQCVWLSRYILGGDVYVLIEQVKFPKLQENWKQDKKIPKIVDLGILTAQCAYSNSETEFCYVVRILPQRKWLNIIRR